MTPFNITKAWLYSDHLQQALLVAKSAGDNSAFQRGHVESARASFKIVAEAMGYRVEPVEVQS